MGRGGRGEFCTDTRQASSLALSPGPLGRRPKESFSQGLRETEATAVCFASKVTPRDTEWRTGIVFLSLCCKAPLSVSVTPCCPLTFGVVETAPLARVQVYPQRAA